MSDKPKKLFGRALAKAKREKRAVSLNRKKTESATENLSVVSSASNICDGDVLLQPHSNEGFAPQLPDSNDVSPFLGFSSQRSPHSQKISTQPSAKEESPFLGFSPQPPFIRPKRKSFDLVHGTNLPITPLPEKRKSADLGQDFNLKIAPIRLSDDEVEPDPVRLRSFFKIVLGDFDQFSDQFPKPHYQCSSMAATALAFSTIKSVDQWAAADINDILYNGQGYYNKCLEHVRLHPQGRPSRIGFLEAGELKPKFKIGSRKFEIEHDWTNIKGGPFDVVNNDTLQRAVEDLERSGVRRSLMTFRDYTYALLRIDRGEGSGYVFFDSHGRKSDGSKPDRGNETGNAAILFFDNKHDFVRHFIETNSLSEPSLANAIVFVPMTFHLTETDEGDEEEQECLPYRIVCGDFSEVDVNDSRYGWHQCAGIVIFSFFYSTLHLATSWSASDLNEILNCGTLFFEKCMQHASSNNATLISDGTIEPLLFCGPLSYKSVEYNVDVLDPFFRSGVNRDHIVDAFRDLELLQIAFAVFSVKKKSYGLISCGECYIFFDSHGRNHNGIVNGPHSAVFYFETEDAIIDHLLYEFSGNDRFDVYPVLFMPVAQNISTPQVSPIAPSTLPLDNIAPAILTFDKIVCAEKNESDSGFDGHSHCIAASIIAIFYSYVATDVESWCEEDLTDIFDQSISYHSASNETAIDNNVGLPLLSVSSFQSEFIVDECEYKVCVADRQIGPPRHSVRLSALERPFRFFHSSARYYFAILTVNGKSFAVCKYGPSGRLMFYDIHGRNTNGENEGNFSAAIYFTSSADLISFIRNEYQQTDLFSMEYIEIEHVTNGVDVSSCLYSDLLSGNFAQNDARFSDASRNTQCAANSVVFLAFAFVLQNDWIPCDIDAILELGDHIYQVSYQEAIQLRPRNHTFLAAYEVKGNIFVHVDRLDRGVVSVQCEALIAKETSGNFGRDAENRIQLFFRHFKYGVFICCCLAVGLFKLGTVYYLFDPHERSGGGKLQSGGRASIFIFENVSSLFAFLLKCGYSTSRDFTLTPFSVEEVLANRPGYVPAPLNRRVTLIQVDGVSDDDIPIAKSGDWEAEDDVPLGDLVKRKSQAPSVKNVQRTKSREQKKIEQKRRQRRYQLEKEKIALETQEVQNIEKRWKAYSKRCKRSQTPNIFGSKEAFEKFYWDHREDGSDEELIIAADNTIDQYTRAEQTRQLRMRANAMRDTYIQAFGNHEDIDEADPKYNLYQLSPMDQVCPHCGALYFIEECNSRKIFRTCCNFGQVHSDLPERLATSYPPFLRDLLLHQSPLSRHFMDNILLYNNVLSFASLGTTNVHHMQARGSLGPVIAMEGMIYHIAEHFHTNSTGANMPTAQLYYIDTSTAVAERQSRAGHPLNAGLLRQLENFMRAHNPLAAAYRMLKEVLDEVRRRPNANASDVHLQIVRNRDQIRIRQNHGGDFAVPTSNEVAAVYTHLPSASTKNIVVFPVDQAPENGIALASHDPNRDAMMYPILFPHSEQTWSYNLFRKTDEEIAQEQASPLEIEPKNDSEPEDPQEEENSEPEDDGRESRSRRKRRRITIREFFCFMLMFRMAFSPILNAGKLTQQFIIDGYARAQENTFEYLQSDRGQKQICSETYGALKDFIDRKKIFQPDLPGKIIVMPNDIVGSRQYMKRRYADALAMVAKYGKPTFFVTMTCNPMWDEIQSRIPRGSNAVDHPEIVARVFKAKVGELIKDISKNHVLGRCVAFLAVIEWQKRSLPHCHLVTFNAPEDRPETHLDIDKFVSAEIPDREKQPRLYEYVTTYMYHHRCDNTDRKETCQVPREGAFSCPRHSGEDPTKRCTCYVCSKKFPKQFAATSRLIEGSYPIYRRRNNGRSFTSSRQHTITNEWIVPYNPQLLLKYNCHINVEITSSLKSIKYLFKYLHKGFDMARLNIKVIDNVQVYNEFEHFVDCRYLSAGEAAWKLFDFPMFYQSHTVYSLPVHLENYQNVIFQPDDPAGALRHADSHLTAYFELNATDPNARQYLYDEIPLHYVFHKNVKKWKPRKRRVEKTLSRLYTVDYNRIELYSLRLLLLSVRGATSFEGIRTVDGVVHETFRQAACALGLLDDDTLHIQTFEEIVDVEMPYRIRCMFVNMLLFNSPSDPVAIWDMFKHKMFEDYVRKGYSEEIAEDLALRHISRLLVANGRTNSEFSLPEPQPGEQPEQSDEVDDATLISLAGDAIEAQSMVDSLNVDQKRIFDEIVDSVWHPNDPQKHRLFFVDGPGGTGKTFLFCALIRFLNTKGVKVLPIAWTGIAASLLKGGRTVHSTFKLPFDITGPVGCNLSTMSDLADEIRESTVIVWDEISMSVCFALDAVDTFCRDLMGNNLPFGGKIFIATGDFRQILPIVKSGTKYDVLNVIAKKSSVWRLLQKRALTINVRLTDPNDIQFAQLLLDIGEGKVNDYPPNEYCSSYVKLPAECIEETSLLDRIYGRTFSSENVDDFSKYVIVTALHEDVNFLNREIYKRMTEDVPTEHTYLSSDKVIGLHPNDDDAYDVSLLNSLEPPNLPPHVLQLKRNCIVTLLMNLNPAQGLCNGTRLIVTKLYKTCIRAKILTGNFKGEEVLLSRCRFKTDSIDVSCPVQRIQIPVKLGHVITFNRAQGQTSDRVGVYMRKPVFAHGQLYVALSRVRSKENLIIQVFPSTLMGKLVNGSEDVYVPNCVYKEVFI